MIQMGNLTLWEFGSTQGAENLSVGIFCQAGKMACLIVKLAPGGQVYLVTQMRIWTLWEFGSARGTENLFVSIFCQAGKNGMPHFEIGQQGAEFI